eukprot:COSAG05_NODE_2279_length_3291_cov_50.910324_2_plen_96_part_00
MQCAPIVILCFLEDLQRLPEPGPLQLTAPFSPDSEPVGNVSLAWSGLLYTYRYATNETLRERHGIVLYFSQQGRVGNVQISRKQAYVCMSPMLAC